ncbi:LppX_LprAFG lipoprotein [Prauserella rugosa]|uniref:Lipoprotein LprG n=1 Tax=Prauserella rugosa TaxID=43354 RepID=A0A660CM96_9PSEU|nr:LppX_LprAFG lipoprotein [Prauserella rugosa]TWH22361.1 lipoprotein LprG [Prauserella rugosa]
MRTRRLLAGSLAAVAFAATACSDSDESLPDGAQLVDDAAKATSDIESTHFALQVNGDIQGLVIQSLDGDLTSSGEAEGSGTLKQAGQLVEIDFVLTDGSLHVKGPTGGYQQLPESMVTSIYDPAAVLDPDRGVAKLVSSLDSPETTAQEEVNGVETYKVEGKLERDVLAEILPGVPSAADVAFWLRDDESRLPVKATATFGESTVDITLSDVNKPVSIDPPQ